MKDKKSFVELLVGGERYTILKGYVFDKLIFGCFILLVLAMFLLVFFLNGSDRNQHVYFKCAGELANVHLLIDGSQSSGCENPFYLKYPLCSTLWQGACSDAYVDSGFVYGEPMPYIVKIWGSLVIFLLCLAFVVNHLFYNLGYKFDEGENYDN